MSIESVVNSYVDACEDAAEVRVLIQEAIADSQSKEEETKSEIETSAETPQTKIPSEDHTREEDEGRPCKMQRNETRSTQLEGYEARLTQLECRVDNIVSRMALNAKAVAALLQRMKKNLEQNEEFLKQQHLEFHEIFQK